MFLCFCLWAVDLNRLPKPEEIEVRRLWQSTLQLREPAEATLEFLNRGKSDILLRVQEEAPLGLRKEIPEMDVRVPAGDSQNRELIPFALASVATCISATPFCATNRAWQIAERWAVGLAETDHSHLSRISRNRRRTRST